MTGYDLNLKTTPPGLFIGANPDWELAQQKVAAGDAFKDGLPTTDGTQNGPVDWMGAAKVMLQKGDFATANNLMNYGLSQQQLKAASAPSEVLGGGPPVQPTTSAPVSGSPPSGGAMPLFQKAIAGVESNSNYGAQGPVTKTGDRAYGKYQVMGANIPSWTKEILGQEMTPEQFTASPQAQDAVFNGKFHQYLQKTGNPQDAASMWFTGRPLAAGGANAQDQLGTTGSGYVAKFMAALPGYRPPANDPSSTPSPSASTNAAPVQVADNGASDAPTPSSTHPYAPSPPVGPLAGQGTPMSPPGAPTSSAAPTSTPTDPNVVSLPTAAPSAPSRPNTPYASNGTNLVDPTLGGLVTPDMLQKYGSYGGIARALAAEANANGTNPFARIKVENDLNMAKEIMSRVSKAQELTNEQKNARDPLVLQSQNDLATTRARARADATAENALVPSVQPDGSATLIPKKVALALAAKGTPALQSLPGYVTSGQANLLTKLNDGSQAYSERQVAGERLDALSDLLSSFQTGANTTAFGDAKAKLASIGIPIPASAMKDVASMQQFTKDAYANVLSTMKEQGNKQFVSEMQSAVNSNPNVELQPAANAAMIAQMQGIRQYHDQNYRDYADWYNTNKGASNDAKFQIDWAKANPLGTYVSSAAKNIAPMGVPIPAPAARTVGQRYSIPGKGVFRWMGTGWSAQ